MIHDGVDQQTCLRVGESGHALELAELELRAGFLVAGRGAVARAGGGGVVVLIVLVGRHVAGGRGVGS